MVILTLNYFLFKDYVDAKQVAMVRDAQNQLAKLNAAASEGQ